MLSEAAATFRAAMEGRGRALGQTHLETISTLCQLEEVLEALGRAGEAAGLLRDAASACDRDLGPSHPRRYVVLLRLGQLLARMGEREAAAGPLREAAEGRARLYGEADARTVEAREAWRRFEESLGGAGQSGG